MSTFVLDDAALMALASSPEVVSRFPELARILSARPGGCCGRRDARGKALAAARSALSALSEPRRRELKDLLGAGEVVFRPASTPGRRRRS